MVHRVAEVVLEVEGGVLLEVDVVLPSSRENLVYVVLYMGELRPRLLL